MPLPRFFIALYFPPIACCKPWLALAIAPYLSHMSLPLANITLSNLSKEIPGIRTVHSLPFSKISLPKIATVLRILSFKSILSDCISSSDELAHLTLHIRRNA